MGSDKVGSKDDEKIRKIVQAWDKYAREVIKAITRALVNIINEKSITRKKKMVDLFLEELASKKDDIISAFIFTIKPDFRELYIESMRKVEKALENMKKKKR